MASPVSDRDRVAKLIGEYLLKGYTLLDSYCTDCNTPLMRRRDEDSFCVHCRDVLSKPIAEVKVEEISNVTSQVLPGKKRQATKENVTVSEAIEVVIANSTRKLTWASSQLEDCTDVQACLQLNQLIQSTLTTLEKAIQLGNQ